MGNWQLEAFKMGFYVFFPLTVFYICNKTEYFKEDSSETKWMGAYHKPLSEEEVQKGKKLHDEFQDKMYQIAERKRIKNEAVELKLLEEKRKAFNAASS